jgi:hypothetical protein
MLHFSADLSQVNTPGAFGWDTTASVVPSRLIPSYTGSSSYLLATKYNKYSQHIYQIGLLDPNASMVDPYSGVTVMNEVQTVDGPTSGREWCINDAAVDPFAGSVLANSEDGKLYRWDLASNTLTESIGLDRGYSEAYTPTLIGPDGTVYSINDGILFAVQAGTDAHGDSRVPAEADAATALWISPLEPFGSPMLFMALAAQAAGFDSPAAGLPGTEPVADANPMQGQLRKTDAWEESTFRPGTSTTGALRFPLDRLAVDSLFRAGDTLAGEFTNSASL